MADSCFDKNAVSASIKRRFVKIKRRFILTKGRFGNPNRRDFVTFAKKDVPPMVRDCVCMRFVCVVAVSCFLKNKDKC